jgi:PAS domain-containing protein
MAVDITDRVQAEAALRESEEKYRTLVNSTLQGVVITKPDPVRLVFANQESASSGSVRTSESRTSPRLLKDRKEKAVAKD